MHDRYPAERNEACFEGDNRHGARIARPSAEADGASLGELLSAALVPDGEQGLGTAQLQAAVAALPPETAVALVLVEHDWALGLASAVDAAGGRVVAQGLLTNDALLTRARDAFNQGEYRWVAQVVNHLVFADPDNRAALDLQADALEQLGYQAESGPWRNFYLSGAKELRDGVIDMAAPKSITPDTVRATPLDMFFDLLAVQLIGPEAAGKVITLNARFTDIDEEYVLRVENGVLNYYEGATG